MKQDDVRFIIYCAGTLECQWISSSGTAPDHCTLTGYGPPPP